MREGKNAEKWNLINAGKKQLILKKKIFQTFFSVIYQNCISKNGSTDEEDFFA